MSNRNARRKRFAGVEEDAAVALSLSSDTELRRSEMRYSQSSACPWPTNWSNR
jgi:hypothetical protein